MTDQPMDKGALALHYAWKLVEDAMPQFVATGHTEGEYGEQIPNPSKPGSFWQGVDPTDRNAVMDRLREQASFIGELALRLDGKL